MCAADHVVRFTRPSPSVFAYGKQSKTGVGKAGEQGYAKPQLSVFSWLCNSEAILYVVAWGLVELCSVLQRRRNLL